MTTIQDRASIIDTAHAWVEAVTAEIASRSNTAEWVAATDARIAAQGAFYAAVDTALPFSNQITAGDTA